MKGLIQPQLARAAQIPTATIQRIRTRGLPLSGKNAEAIAGVLGITVEKYRDAYQQARRRPPGPM
jgi:hypothetical protein